MKQGKKIGGSQQWQRERETERQQVTMVMNSHVQWKKGEDKGGGAKNRIPKK